MSDEERCVGLLLVGALLGSPAITKYTGLNLAAAPDVLLLAGGRSSAALQATEVCLLSLLHT